MADPRRAALASLFIVEHSGNLYALRVRDQATGGWALRPDERVECPVSMLEARMLALRDGLVDAALAALDAAEPARAAECTGTTAKWCPVHGDCTCPETLPGERTFDDDRCPLHAPTSRHGEQERAHLEAPDPGAVRAEEHERAALVRERDEALADRDNIQRTAQALRDQAERLLEELNATRAELAARSPEGRKAAQLALFAAAEADPAGEAQRAAASGAAVGAIVGAAADAPAPPNLRPWKPAAAAKVPAPVCAPCGGVPLVPAADMPREGEATGGKPLGCPACGDGYDGTPEQIALAQADSEAATKRIAAAEGKCWRCWGPRHRGRCKGAR